MKNLTPQQKELFTLVVKHQVYAFRAADDYGKFSPEYKISVAALGAVKAAFKIMVPEIDCKTLENEVLSAASVKYEYIKDNAWEYLGVREVVLATPIY